MLYKYLFERVDFMEFFADTAFVLESTLKMAIAAILSLIIFYLSVKIIFSSNL